MSCLRMMVLPKYLMPSIMVRGILSLDNKNKKFLICFVLFSLIRIFALMKAKKHEDHL